MTSPPDAEAAQERNREQQHEREPDRDGEPAEQDRAAGVDHRLLDRLAVLQAPAALVAVAVDDEQRVVDGDAEPDHQHHVAEVVAEFEQVRRAPGDAERGRDRGGGEQERQQRRARSEDEQQDHEGGRHGEVELADLQVVGEHRREVVLHGRVAGDEDVRAELPPQQLDLLGGAVAAQRRLDERDGGAGREPLHALDAAAGKEAARLRGGAVGPHDGVVVLRDEHEDGSGADAVLLRQHLLHPRGVRARQREAGLQQRRQPQRRDEAEHDHGEPHGGDEQPVPEREGGQARERAEFAALEGQAAVTAVRIGMLGARLKGDRAERRDRGSKVAQNGLIRAGRSE